MPEVTVAPEPAPSRRRFTLRRVMGAIVFLSVDFSVVGPLLRPGASDRFAGLIVASIASAYLLAAFRGLCGRE
jgi:hypothetical protein